MITLTMTTWFWGPAQFICQLPLFAMDTKDIDQKAWRGPPKSYACMSS